MNCPDCDYREPDIAPNDRELQVIIRLLDQLEELNYSARVRVLNYVGARLNPDLD